MNTFDFIEGTISHQLKDPHSKVLEPDCLSLSASNYDTASEGERGRVRGQMSKNLTRLYQFGVDPAFGKAVDFLRSLTAI
jgi:hypothetical protein